MTEIGKREEGRGKSDAPFRTFERVLVIPFPLPPSPFALSPC